MILPQQQEEQQRASLQRSSSSSSSSKSKMTNMMMYVCYLCGKEHGSKSIAIHEKRCLVLKQKQQQGTKKKKIARRPPLENAKSLMERNAMARRAYETSILVKCSGCHNTFQGDDKLRKHHEEGCEELKRKQRRKNEIEFENNPAEPILRRRRLGASSSMPVLNVRSDNTNESSMMHACYLCGRDYGSNSIATHEKKCLELKQKQQQSSLGKNKIPPRPPFEKANSLKERNDMARRTYERTMMEKCPGCQRTFQDHDKLSKHMKGCEDVKHLNLRKSGIRDCMVPGTENYNDNRSNYCQPIIATEKRNSVKIIPLQQRRQRPPRGPSSSLVVPSRRKIPQELQSQQELQFRLSSSASVPIMNTTSSISNETAKTNMHLCYICGREYGSNSIAIHEQQCYELKLKQQQGKKRLLIRPPLENAKSLQERNTMAQQAYETMMTEQCPGCQRTFNAKDKLAKHMKGCEEAKLIRPNGIRSCMLPGGALENEFDNIIMMNNNSDEKVFCQIITPSKTTIDQHLNNTANQSQRRSRSFSCSSLTSTSSSLPHNIYLCYICGRQYGSNSIASHERKCMDLFQKQQEVLLPKEKKKIVPPQGLPPPGDPFTRVLRNDMIMEFQQTKVMEKCIGCHRTFDDKVKLQKHMKGCKAAAKKIQAEAKKTNTPLLRDCVVPDGSGRILTDSQVFNNNSSRGVGSSSKMHLCYICGREYGSKSIAIHEKQCKVLFQKQQQNLPEEEQKPLPQRPDFRKSSSLIERNAMARSTYNIFVMETCTGCNRTFYGKDKLLKHQKGCGSIKKQQKPILRRNCSTRSNQSMRELNTSTGEFIGFNSRSSRLTQSCRF